MLNKIKIIFIDLDGTLLDIKINKIHGISKENLDAIKMMQKKGVKVIISTGRFGISAAKCLALLDHFDYAVTGNGSAIVKGNEIVKSYKMSKKDSVVLRNFAKKNKLTIKVDDSRKVYGLSSIVSNIIIKIFNFEVQKNYLLNVQTEYYKITIWGKSRKKMKQLQLELKEKLPHLSIVSSSKNWVLELTHENATKGSANAYVAEKFFGITSKNEMLHIGDSMNDSTCVDKMEVVALKNSTSDFYKLAKWVGPHYKHGGVAKVLNGEIKLREKK